MMMTMMKKLDLIINNEHSFRLQHLHKARGLILMRLKNKLRFSIISARI
jgi:hypothetical protein